MGALEMEQFLANFFGKSGISVKDIRMRCSMKLEDIIHENLRNYGGCEWVLERK
jgi:hypothetical protein